MTCSGYCPNCGKYVTLIPEPIKRFWAIRGDRIRALPKAGSKTISWLIAKDIVESDGQIIQDEYGDEWLKIQVIKFDKLITGYCVFSIFEPYKAPVPDNDPDNPANAERVFDLSAIIAKPPKDSEIAYAEIVGRPSQYINVVGVGGKKPYNFNLCGEFCAAAIYGSDVVPLLQAWRAFYPRAEKIIRDDKTTGIPDLKSMLDVFGLDYVEQRFDSSNPISPLKACTGIGISGCAINRQGKIYPKGSIRHWVVIEDCLPVGTSGWIRVYNPMVNKSEVYNFDVYAKTNPGVILWLK